jgi:Xaa-Pro dipeptidase
LVTVQDSYQRHHTPASEIEHRIARLQEGLGRENREAALILQNVDLYYFTGCLQAGALFVPAEGSPLFMVQRSLERARRESSIPSIIGFKSIREIPDMIAGSAGGLPSSIGMELDVVPVNIYRKYASLLGNPDIFDLSPLARKIRGVKSPYEIDVLARVGELGRIVYDEAASFIVEGASEIEVAGKMIDYAVSLGHLNQLRSRAFNSEMFTWHVVSGENGGIVGHLDAPFTGRGVTPAFPAGAGFRKIKCGDPVLIDFGACLDGYIADQTRMFSLGQPDPLFLKAYDALREIEARILEQARPGAPCDELYRIGLTAGEELGFGDSFLGPGNRKIKFVGHGVGLEIDEFPFLAAGHDYPLEEGNVFALELKMVFPGRGAVGFENMVVITEDGWSKLTTTDENFRIL